MAEDVRYRHILGEVYGKPWAILPQKLEVIADIVRFRAEGGHLTREEIDARLEAARPAAARPKYAVASGSAGNVAVIPLYGVIMPRATLFSEFSGGCSLESFQQAFQAAMADATISSILLPFDSPGGSVDLVTEIAAMIRDARGNGKPIVAIANTMAASAAYCLAAQADELIVTPSGEVGSIGCIAIHFDYSRLYDMAGVTPTMITFGQHKADGYPYAPLSADAEQALQDSVDAFGLMFESDVAKGRGVSQQTVHDKFGQGLMFGAQKAVEIGLADKVDTLQKTVERLAHTPSRARVGGGSSAEAPELEPEDDDTPVPADDDTPAVDETREDSPAREGAVHELSELKGSLDAATERLRQAHTDDSPERN